MRKTGIFLLALGGILIFLDPVMAEQNLAETLAGACKTEIERHCGDSEGADLEIVGCLGEHLQSGEFSVRCEYVLKDVSLQLARALFAASYVAIECSRDLDKYCAGVKAGEGRLLGCLQLNDADVSKGCKQARRDAGLN